MKSTTHFYFKTISALGKLTFFLIPTSYAERKKRTRIVRESDYSPAAALFMQ